MDHNGKFFYFRGASVAGGCLSIVLPRDQFFPDLAIILSPAPTSTLLAPGLAQGGQISPDGRLVATGISIWKRDEPTRRWISVWDLETVGEVAHIDGYDKRVSRVAFAPDGKRLASTHDDTTILVWDLEQFHVAGPKPD